MYQPKIREENIRKLYQEAKRKKVKMTALINQLVERHFEDREILDNLETAILTQAKKEIYGIHH